MEELPGKVVTIGGPVRDRAWILPRWFAHTGEACVRAGIKPEFVFALSKDDHDTADALSECAAGLHCVADLIFTDEKAEPDIRFWSPGRYAHMAELRNKVLQRVRQIGPSFHLSLDSDLLLEPDALAIALTKTSKFDAVGIKAYMQGGRVDKCPSYAMLRGDALIGRFDAQEGCFPVDVVMAGVVMNPDAYWIDYETHIQGEDIGWSKAAKKDGLKLGWCADARAKHVMERRMLDEVDPRLGW